MNKKAWPLYFAYFLLFGLIVAAFLAPLLTTFDPVNMDLKSRLLLPSFQHFFGTDQNGVDVFSQVLFGARVSLQISFFVVGIGIFIGLTVGSLAGYYAGWWDQILMRLVDMVYAFPGFLLILAVAAVVQSSSLWSVIFVLSLTHWATYARLVRGEILHLKQREHVLSAEAIGASHLRKLIFHIWPNLIGPLGVQASFSMAAVIITESSLSFLGIGLSPTIPTWGNALNSGRHYLIEAPHLSFFPGMALLTVVLSFNLIGDGLRDQLDPKKE